jgi:hypothetical protein
MRILLVGDTHGRASWWESFITPTARLLKADMVFQLGDFGYWPNADRFLHAVSTTGIPVAFLDGNHEHHPFLQEKVQGRRKPVPVAENLVYVPRGCHLFWDGVQVAVLGGAHSIDRTLRTPGHSWFPDEDLTDEDLAHLASTGTAQVLLSHDAPLCAPVPLSDREELPGAWYRELPACEKNRVRMDEALDIVQPRIAVHGHYHVRYEAEVPREWGTTHFVGLSHDGTGVGNLAVLECDRGVASIRDVTELPR